MTLVATVPQPTPFTDDDRDELARRGMSVEEALAQLERLARGSGDVTLDRPALAGDGILRLAPSQQDALRARYERVRRAGRITSFVPASGAASRMFASLLAWKERSGPLTPAELHAAARAGDLIARDTAEFFRHVREFAFAPALEQALSVTGARLDALVERGPHRPVLEALLEEPGLGLGLRPKGLVPFHPEGAGFRTALDEHLVDAARLVSDGRGRARIHFTLSPEHDAEVGRWLGGASARWESRLAVRLDVGRSTQRPSSDTLAADPLGRPFRGPDGRLVFRPGGHGALLGNLAECGADLAFIKNVDNVAAEPWKAPTDEWVPFLIGALAELEEHRARAWDQLNAGPSGIAEAEKFLRERLGETPPEGPPEGRLGQLLARLDRPIRVCGMVPATGDPGGGPFWVQGRDGRASLQIVEGAQVSRDPGQRSILARSTHFNPVFMAVALRDPRGKPYDLNAFTDPEAVIVTRKPWAGRELLALERPGLWNGGMAHWITQFLEVPPGVFTPVKTIQDLLRPEHRVT